MKKVLFFLLLTGTTSIVHAQTWDSVTTNRDQIFVRTEIEPSFNGGEKAWGEHLKKTMNQKFFKESKAPAGVYTVLVQFIVHKDGSLTDVQAVTKHGYGMEGEAERIIKHTPRWIAPRQNGRDVTAYHRQPITFVIE